MAMDNHNLTQTKWTFGPYFVPSSKISSEWTWATELNAKPKAINIYMKNWEKRTSL